MVELIVVMAILAILVGVAISQYSSYKNRVKAKDLITMASACVHEIVAHCESDTNFSQPQTLENCQGRNATGWLTNISFNATPSFFNFSCNRTFTITATGQIKNSSVWYQTQCTYNATRQEIYCSKLIRVH